jgi:hypothetical protein
MIFNSAGRPAGTDPSAGNFLSEKKKKKNSINFFTFLPFRRPLNFSWFCNSCNLKVFLWIFSELWSYRWENILRLTLYM